MPRVLAPGPAEAEKDPEEQGWAARQGAGEGPGWAWSCPPPQNPAGCTHWRQDPSQFSQITPAPTDPVGSTYGETPGPVTIEWAPISAWGGHIPPSTGCPSECGIPTALARAQCRMLGQYQTGDSPCVGSTHGTAGTLACGVGDCPWPPPARPWPPSCAGWGEPGEGGAGRTVYVCRCQVLAGHCASRAGAQLLNPLQPPHTPPARDQARPTPPGWSLCTPIQPATPFPKAPHDQQWPGGSRDPGQPCSRGSWWAGGAAAQKNSPRTMCRHSPQHMAAPQLGGCGHPKCGSWVFQMGVLGVLTKLHSQNPPGQRCGARGHAAPRQGPRSPAPTPFPPVPAGAG